MVGGIKTGNSGTALKKQQMDPNPNFGF